MLKIFRRIRRKLLDERNLKRYLFYAIGEIAIVMIGILLALQVNNWNSNRNYDIAMEQLIEGFEADLIKNIEEATRVINLNYDLYPLYQMVLRGEVNRDMYRKDNRLRFLIRYQYKPFVIKDNLLNILEKNHLGSRYNSLLKTIKNYKNLIDDENEIKSLAMQNATDNSVSGNNDFTWFQWRDSLSIEKGIEYFLSDPIYLNKVHASHDLIIDNYTRRIIKRRNIEIGLLNAIQKIKNTSSKEISSDSIFQKFGLRPFKIIGCEAEELRQDWEYGFRNSFLLSNEGSNPITINVYGSAGFLIDQIDLLPGEFITSYSFGKQKGNHVVGLVFELIDAEGCLQKYVAVKDGYLLIKE